MIGKNVELVTQPAIDFVLPLVLLRPRGIIMVDYCLWPDIAPIKALKFIDLLELQYARNRSFVALVVGAFDGVTNDATNEFIRKHRCGAILVEPQLRPFERLRAIMSGHDNVILLNAAIDEVSGFRDIYYVQHSSTIE